MGWWPKVWESLRRVALGVILIVTAGVVLLASDWGHRRTRPRALPRVALFQFASRPVMDEGIQGVVDGLAARGWVEGQTVSLRRYNAENDMPTANAIARSLVDERYDLVVTASTPCLQAVAAANPDGAVRHVFGVVTDPYIAGVGLDRGHPESRPPWMAGVATFQPVKEAFRLARRLNPELAVVGEVWSPAEACSEACTVLAREVAAELGITLLEAPVDSSAGVLEAARSLVARGAEALWIGGDNTVEMAASSVVKAAGEGGIPVFANAPGHAESGALFGLGADYYEVGRTVGGVAADVLEGREPRSIPIDNVVPQRLAVDESVVAGLRQRWSIPDDVRRQAVRGDDASTRAAGGGSGGVAAPEDAKAGSARPWRVHVLSYAETTFVEESEAGIRAELAARGLEEGRDVVLEIASAQGDMATLSMLLDNAASRADLVLLSSTPALQAAVKRVTTVPIVFGNVANPILAGAGRSFDDHHPNVTGVATAGDFEGMARLLRECLPAARRVGTLVAPAELNSVYNRDAMAEALAGVGVELVSVAVATATEVPDAALALCGGEVDAICQVTSSLVDTSFSALAQAATRRRLPLFAFSSGLVEHSGAAVALARDYEQVGRDMVELALRVRAGVSPAGIPFTLPSRTVLVVSPANAAATGLTVPDAVLTRADRVVR